MPDLFARAMREIMAIAPDLLVVSGDLVDYPLDAMNDPFLMNEAHGDLVLVAKQLNQVACPKAVVFGNHDHPDVFRRVFGSVSSDQIVHGFRVLSFMDCEGPDHVPIRVDLELYRFIAALNDPATLPQIHVQHYLVWPERNENYPHTYGTGDSLHREMVASGNVRLALSGHYHAGVTPTFSKGVWFAAVPSFAEHPHPYWVYELDGDNLSWTQHEIGAALPNG